MRGYPRRATPRATLLSAVLLSAVLPVTVVGAAGPAVARTGTPVDTGSAAGRPRAEIRQAAVPDRPVMDPSGRLRMEIAEVRATPYWTTVSWRLINVSRRPVRLSAVPLHGDDPGRSRASSAADGLRLISGQSRHLALSGDGGRCLCTYLGGRSLATGRSVTGFTTFPALSGHEPAVRIEVPGFGAFRAIPISRTPSASRTGSRYGGPHDSPDDGRNSSLDDGTGFTVEGIDRLPYATVLRVRKRPGRPDQALARPERLTNSPHLPLAAGEVALIDPRSRTAYTPLYGPNRCMCADFSAGVNRDGTVRGVYVFPYVPFAPRLRVWFSGGLPIDEVPVTEVRPPARQARPAPAVWPRQNWPVPRPTAREVAAYPAYGHLGFRAVTDRPGVRHQEYGRQVHTSLLFRLDSAVLRPAARTALRRLAQEITRRTDIKGVRVAGSADPSGTEPYNLRLSERRARAVARFLARAITREDVFFDVRAHGETRPPAAAGTGGTGGTGLLAGRADSALSRNATVVLPR